MMFRLLIIVLLMTPLSQNQGEPQRGRLIVVVRNHAGQRLPGIRIGLYYDADAGRIELGEYVTDEAGQIMVPDLAWGLYIVQFRGSTPTGLPVQPAEQQNQGLLDDGKGIDNGFGVRLAAAERTELFVLTTSLDQVEAVPLFDLAPGPDAPPQPINPLTAGPLPAPSNVQPLPIPTNHAQLPAQDSVQQPPVLAQPRPRIAQTDPDAVVSTQENSSWSGLVLLVVLCGVIITVVVMARRSSL